MSQSVSQSLSNSASPSISQSLGWLSAVSQLFGQSGIQQVSHLVSLRDSKSVSQLISQSVFQPEGP